MSPTVPDPASRLLIVPGLHDSPSDHWQTWLQGLFPGALRVTQRDWAQPDVDRWAGRVGSTLERGGPGPWLAVAHSFGVLALLRHLQQVPQSPVAAVLLVAPADPDRFGLGELLSHERLALPGTVLLSNNDPWLSLAAGLRWSACWGTPCVNLGRAGHINAQAGFHTLPYARQWVLAHQQRLLRESRGAAAKAEGTDWRPAPAVRATAPAAFPA